MPSISQSNMASSSYSRCCKASQPNPQNVPDWEGSVSTVTGRPCKAIIQTL